MVMRYPLFSALFAFVSVACIAQTECPTPLITQGENLTYVTFDVEVNNGAEIECEMWISNSDTDGYGYRVTRKSTETTFIIDDTARRNFMYGAYFDNAKNYEFFVIAKYDCHAEVICKTTGNPAKKFIQDVR